MFANQPIANIRNVSIHTHVTQNATGTSSVQPFCPFCSIQCAIRPFLTLFPKGFSELMQSACLLCSITCELLPSIDPCVRFLSMCGLLTKLVFTTVHAIFFGHTKLTPFLVVVNNVQRCTSSGMF